MMKNNASVSACILVMLMSLVFPAYSSGGKKDPDIFLTAECHASSVLFGEMVGYDVMLYSSTPDISGVLALEEPHFGCVEVFPLQSDSRLSEIKDKGKTYYTAVVARYYLRPSEAGDFRLPGQCFVVGVEHRRIMTDPLWGDYVQTEIEEVNVKAPDIKLRVKDIPSRGCPDNFSGAVGDFTFSVDVPKGDIVKGENAVVVFTLSGTGDLENISAPDLSGCFSGHLRFRSMSPEKTHFIKNGELCSEMEIVCEFVADKSGAFVINPADFVFYSKKTSCYTSVSTLPVEINVKESSVSSRLPDYMEI